MASRTVRTRLLAGSIGLIVAFGGTRSVAAKSEPVEVLTADLDGIPIKLNQVGNWNCDDFSYPVIHCYSNPIVLEARAALVQSVTAVDFVTVYELGSFSGSYMHMSQDYTALVTIGWNDRISSLKGRNSEQSHFFVDWFYGGTSYFVCCDSQVTSLGSFDNTFSSVHRN